MLHYIMYDVVVYYNMLWFIMLYNSIILEVRLRRPPAEDVPEPHRAQPGVNKAHTEHKPQIKQSIQTSNFYNKRNK